jgi:hypothetical protein
MFYASAENRDWGVGCIESRSYHIIAVVLRSEIQELRVICSKGAVWDLTKLRMDSSESSAKIFLGGNVTVDLVRHVHDFAQQGSLAKNCSNEHTNCGCSHHAVIDFLQEVYTLPSFCFVGALYVAWVLFYVGLFSVRTFFLFLHV